jgi:hypothetical protein
VQSGAGVWPKPAVSYVMTDITADIHVYRETARHLWNSCLRNIGGPSATTIEAFDRICEELFSAIVLDPHGIEESPEQLNIQGFRGLRVVPGVAQGTPILINRTTPPGPYWDDPLVMVRPEDIQLSLIGLFDWDSYSNIDMRFLRVHVNDCRVKPEVIGREALIEVFHSKVTTARSRTAKGNSS